MKNRFAAIIVLLCLLLTACSVTEGEVDPSGGGTAQNNQQNTRNDFDNPDYENEEDGVEAAPVQKDEDSFVGSWHAPSDKAEYLYGNVNLTISEDHTWTGNITGENFNGHWQSSGSGIVIKSNDGVIDWSLYFTSGDTLMFSDNDMPEKTLVLKPGIR